MKDEQSSAALGSLLVSLCAGYPDHETASPRLLELSDANINLWSGGLSWGPSGLPRLVLPTTLNQILAEKM